MFGGMHFCCMNTEGDVCVSDLCICSGATGGTVGVRQVQVSCLTPPEVGVVAWWCQVAENPECEFYGKLA